MNGRRENATIDALVSDLKPSSYFKRPSFLLSAWLIFGLGYYAFITTDLFHQPLSKITKLDEPSAIMAWLLLSLFIYCSILAFRLGVPGRKDQPWLIWIAVLGTIIWLAMILFGYPPHVVSEARAFGLPGDDDFFCAKYLTLISILPVIVLVAIMRTLAPLSSRRAGALLFLAAGVGAALCLEYFCPHKTAVHRLYGHWSIVVAASLTGLTFGRQLLRW